MADEPFDRLSDHGRSEVPPLDARFADRLESDLRVAHASRAPGRRTRSGAWRYTWGVALAGLIAVAGFVGLSRLDADDPGVPLEVTDEGAIDSDRSGTDGESPEDPDGNGGSSTDGSQSVDVGPTPTPTTTNDRTEPSPTPSTAASDVRPPPTPTPAVSDVRPTPTPAVSDVRPTPTPAVSDVRPTPTPAVSDVRPTPTPTPALQSRPTAVPPRPPPTLVPTRVPTPVPPATPRPLPTATATASATPTPTPRPEPVAISMTCMARAAGDALGVVCEWAIPVGVDFDRFVLVRSRNGGVTSVIASRRGDAERTVIDRDVNPGDTVIYLVRALQGDVLVGASERVNVRIPPR